jgi:hypothetical protein
VSEPCWVDPKEFTYNRDLCECGHPNGPHLIAGYNDPELGFPVGGWRECPECDCRSTWAIPGSGVQQLRAAKRGSSA